MRKTTKQRHSDATPTNGPGSASRSEQGNSRAKLIHERKPKPTLISPPIVETDFVELEDGSLVEMIEDPVDPSKIQFAIYKAGEIRLIDKVESRQRILRPIPRNSEIVRHIRLPRAARVNEFETSGHGI